MVWKKIKIKRLKKIKKSSGNEWFYNIYFPYWGYAINLNHFIYPISH